MKKDLLNLIAEIDDIKTLFHQASEVRGFPNVKTIYDNQEFQNWRQKLLLELEEIFTRTENTFIGETIKVLNAPMKGWSDENIFSEIVGKLLAIQENIDNYYMEGSATTPMNETKPPRIFISHSTKDKNAVRKLVDLLNSLGLSDENIFCSSVPGYDIPLGKDIFSYIREQFLQYDLHVIFIHSTNYYNSPVSLNEMGAAWCLRTKATSFLLPGFKFDEMKGVVNGNTISIKLDNDELEVKDKLNQLRDSIMEDFNLTKGKDIIWEQNRDSFINAINHEKDDSNMEINKYAINLLEKVADDSQGIIITPSTLKSGKSIKVGENVLCSESNRREFAAWESALIELVNRNFIEPTAKGDIYKITSYGYDFLDSVKGN